MDARTSVPVREVIGRAIALGATALIIVHNHPSGEPTRRRARTSASLATWSTPGGTYEGTVHDHVIVGAQGRTSMRAMGLI